MESESGKHYWPVARQARRSQRRSSIPTLETDGAIADAAGAHAFRAWLRRFAPTRLPKSDDPGQ